jgi:hypothetical protein
MEQKFRMMLKDPKQRHLVTYGPNETIDAILTRCHREVKDFPDPHGKCLLIYGKCAWGNMTIGTEIKEDIHLIDKPESIPRSKIYDSESLINMQKSNPSITLTINGYSFERFYYDPTRTIEQLFQRLKESEYPIGNNDALLIDSKYAWGDLLLESVLKKEDTVYTAKKPENILPNQIFKLEKPPSITTTPNPYTSSVLQPAQSAPKELPEELSPETKLLVEYLNLSLGKINSTNEKRFLVV